MERQERVAGSVAVAAEVEAGTSPADLAAESVDRLGLTEEADRLVQAVVAQASVD